MSVRDLGLCEPLLELGIEDVAFWNGRVLAAEDLADQRDAHIERARLVARAGGEGVAHGLMVQAATADRTTVEVGHGIAVSRRGDVLHLPVDVRLRLVPTASEEPALGGFTDCELPDLVGTFTGMGVYVLLIGPAEGTRATAPAVTFESDGVVRQCGPKYEVDGVCFRLVHVDVVGSAAAAGHDQDDLDALTAVAGSPERDRRRNVLAHVFLGSLSRAAAPVDPYGATTVAYGPLDELRASGAVGDDEVPIALVSWVARGVEFADAWAVRRRVHRSLEAEDPLAALTASRARAEGEATWLQFRRHVADLVAAHTTVERSALRADAHFRHLPAAGCVPLEGPGSPGLDGTNFFAGLTTGPRTFMPAATVPRLLRAGFDVPPLAAASGEAVRVYVVSENARAFDEATGADVPQRFLVFARAHLPWEGNARFDVGRFDYANFAPRSSAPEPGGGP